MKRLAVLLAMAVVSLAAIAADRSAERRLKIEFDELAAQATAAIDTVNAMEERARAAGQSLHSSLIARRALVQSSMDEAEKALRADDMGLLRERLKRARGHIDRLYRML
jgi:hypothetical protein